MRTHNAAVVHSQVGSVSTVHETKKRNQLVFATQQTHVQRGLPSVWHARTNNLRLVGLVVR